MVGKNLHPEIRVTQSPYTESLKAAETEFQELEAKIASVKLNIEETEDCIRSYTERKQEFESELERIKARAVLVKTSVGALKSLCEDEDTAKWEERGNLFDKGEWGIQECCYQILLDAGRSLTAAQILEKLAHKQIELHYKNPLAVIHTSLRRLVPDRVRVYKARKKGRSKRLFVWYEALREKAQPSKD